MNIKQHSVSMKPMAYAVTRWTKRWKRWVYAWFNV